MRRLVIVFLFLASCQTNEADAPELLTKPAQQIGSSGAVFEAEIKEVGPIRPINFGFLWDVQGTDLTIVSAANNNVTGTTSSPQTYSINVQTLLPSTTYYYRSFATDTDNSRFHYGAVVSFTTLP